MKAHCVPLAIALYALVVLLLGGVAPGCASMMKEPTVEVRATRNTLAPERAPKTYVLACKNDLMQQWFMSNRKALLALDEALEKLGYTEATDPRTANYEIVAEIGFATRPTLQRNENPDSIRFQNVAAMVGQGRYTQILTERHESSGSLLVGPDGQLIPTGGWKKVMEDTQQRDIDMPGTHDALVLRAWDVGTVSLEPQKVLAWEVIVLRSIDYRTPSPEHVGILIQHAAERLAAGWPDAPAAAPAGGETASTNPPAASSAGNREAPESQP